MVMKLVLDLCFPLIVSLFYFFFHSHHIPTKETSSFSAFEGAQRAIEMCYRNLSPCEFSEPFPGAVLQIP